MSNSYKLSVVIPVYNMEKYIGEAIESILSQTLKEVEIICMDDCGTDRSAEIIREYADKNENVKLFTMEQNGGVGKARATAMTHATGEYIAFMDADDRIRRDDCYEIMLRFAEEGDCDICGGLVSNFTDSGERDDYHRFRSLFKDTDGTSYVDIDFKDYQDDYFFQGFIYRRSLLEKHDITFPDLRAYEDPVFLAEALYYANKIRIVGMEYYDHRYDHKGHDIPMRSMIDFLKGVLIIMNFATEKGLDDLFNLTLGRVNKDLFAAVYSALLQEDMKFMELLLEVERFAVGRGKSLTVIDYLKYLATREDVFNDFMNECSSK